MGDEERKVRNKQETTDPSPTVSAAPSKVGTPQLKGRDRERDKQVQPCAADRKLTRNTKTGSR